MDSQHFRLSWLLFNIYMKPLSEVIKSIRCTIITMLLVSNYTYPSLADQAMTENLDGGQQASTQAQEDESLWFLSPLFQTFFIFGSDCGYISQSELVCNSEVHLDSLLLLKQRVAASARKVFAHLGHRLHPFLDWEALLMESHISVIFHLD